MEASLLKCAKNASRGDFFPATLFNLLCHDPRAFDVHIFYVICPFLRKNLISLSNIFLYLRANQI